MKMFIVSCPFVFMVYLLSDNPPEFSYFSYSSFHPALYGLGLLPPNNILIACIGESCHRFNADEIERPAQRGSGLPDDYSPSAPRGDRIVGREYLNYAISYNSAAASSKAGQHRNQSNTRSSRTAGSIAGM